MTTALSIRTGHRTKDAIRQMVFDRLPRGDHRRRPCVCVSVGEPTGCDPPSPHFPIAALVTSPLVLRAVLRARALIKCYPACEEITGGNVPLQTCDWDLLRTQGIAELEQEFGRLARPRVRFLTYAANGSWWRMASSPRDKLARPATRTAARNRHGEPQLPGAP